MASLHLGPWAQLRFDCGRADGEDGRTVVGLLVGEFPLASLQGHRVGRASSLDGDSSAVVVTSAPAASFERAERSWRAGVSGGERPSHRG
jgi:hypothetical protein